MVSGASTEAEYQDGPPAGVDQRGQLELDIFRRPAEDAGAQTQGNFHYQTEVIASYCLSLHTDASIIKIICEWQEDFIIVRDRPPMLELVSVKHHEDMLYTTMKSLCDQGGVAHLFDRWLSYTTLPVVRLASNTRLGGRPGDYTPRALLDVCRAGELDTPRGIGLVAHLAWAMMEMAAKSTTLDNIPKAAAPAPPKPKRHDPTGLPRGLFEMLQRFVRNCQFDCERPAKPDIRDVNIRRIAEPAASTLGFARSAAATVYKSVVDLVAEASRDDSGRLADLAGYLTNPGAYDPHSELARTVQRRTLTRDMVMDAIRLGARHAVSDSVPLLRAGQAPPRAPGGHHLIEKMRAAMMGDDERDNALGMRDLWLHTWPQARTGFPEDIETQYRLEMEILDIVRQIRAQLIGKSGHYGIQFQALLHSELRRAELSKKTSVPLDDFHILGYAYELSDMCKFGFSRPVEG
ncbi:dsDNA nuclease domain-containing protein [Actinoplanes sp. NPDC000266]